MPALPEASAETLRILLAQDLALPSGQELRQRRLGLLVELVSDGTGEVPPTAHYQAMRAQRQATGEMWPDASALTRAYGSWLQAVAAAMALSDRPTTGTQARRQTPSSRSYTRAEVLAGLRRFNRACGYWPTAKELREFGALERHQARQAGQPDPRIPTREVVLKHFGSWPLAMAASTRSTEETQ